MPETRGYPHPELLETAEWLAQHLNDPDIKILDARSAREYEAGHIPGAILLPNPVFRAAEGPETCSPDEFAETAGRLGIRASDQVVCYNGGPNAGRAWWAFTRFGHRAVRFLNGGMKAWQAGGHPISTEQTSHPPVVYELGELREVACSIPQAVGSLGKPGVLFWDVRSRAEYTGEDPRTNPAERAGHIPGAVHLEWSDLTDPETGKFKPADEMRRLLESRGITPEQEVIAY